jgi:hypothetical protein
MKLSKTLAMKNDYGLGMMDMVIYFTQAIMFRMLSDLSNLTDAHPMTAKYWSLDDSVIKIEGRNPEFDVSLESTQELMEKISDYNSRLEIVIHQKKMYPIQVSSSNIMESHGAKTDSLLCVKTCCRIRCIVLPRVTT